MFAARALAVIGELPEVGWRLAAVPVGAQTARRVVDDMARTILAQLPADPRAMVA